MKMDRVEVGDGGVERFRIADPDLAAAMIDAAIQKSLQGRIRG
jgi:hypothetical protein